MRFLIKIILIFGLIGCREEIVIETIPPELGATTGIAFGDSLFLKGKIISQGSLPIKKYGFVIGKTNKLSLGNPLDVILKDAVQSSDFSTRTLSKLSGETEYYISGFILTEEDTVFGASMVLSGRDKPPVVKSIQPSHGYKGDLIKINGLDFGQNVKVKFGTLEAEIYSTTATQILAKIPHYSESGTVDVMVEKSYKQSTKLPFTLDGPTITHFTPEIGMSEFEVTITGDGFSPTPWRNIVTISCQRNGQNIKYSTTVLTASPDELKIKINATNILPGSYALHVSTDDVQMIAKDSIKIVTPWDQLTDKPFEGRSNSANFEIDGKLYICTGTIAARNSGYSNELWEYNTTSDTWTKKANFPGGARIDAFSFAVNGKGYVGSGITNQGQSFSDLWEYDPAQNSWTKKTGIPDGARTEASSFEYNGKGYVIFGTEGAGWFKRKDFWSYNPTNDSWERLPDFSGNARVRSALCIKNNKLFIIGGYNPETVFKSDSWSYDFTTRQWSFIDYVNFQPQSYVYDDQKCYILALSFNYFFENELNLIEYDPETTTKSFRPMFPGKIRFKPSIMTIHNNRIFVGLGSTSDGFTYFNDMWAYPIQ